MQTDIRAEKGTEEAELFRSQLKKRAKRREQSKAEDDLEAVTDEELGNI